jgi:menaquinone-dependent protoporphyrinogen IX oxidase
MTTTVTIVYESMFGSTRQIAESIASGIEDSTVRVARVDEVGQLTDRVDLLIVGAPTHAHSLSRPASRKQAAEWAADPKQHLTLESHATGHGVREWLDSFSRVPKFVAAFDTRADIPEIFSGAASRKIERVLTKLGGQVLADRVSFVVDKSSQLKPGQRELAREWGSELSAKLRHQLDSIQAR